MDTLPVLVTGCIVRSPKSAVRPLALAAALLIAACSGGSDDTTPTTDAPSEATADTSPLPSSADPPSQGSDETAPPSDPAPPPIVAPDSIAALKWESLAGPPGAGRVTELVQTTGTEHSLFALTERGIYASSDRGDHWDLAEPTGDWVSDITTHDSTLITCGDGVHAIDGPSVVEMLDEDCARVAAGDEGVLAGRGSEQFLDIRVLRSTDSTGEWQDLSPSGADLADLTLPPDGHNFTVQVAALAATGGNVLAGFTVWVEGSGEHTNGGLYRWTDSDNRWTRVDLPAPSTATVGELIVDPLDPRRVFVLLRHALLHDWRSPISGLIFESVDAGATWSPSTDAIVESNGPRDVATVGAATYVLSPADGYMLRIEDDRWDKIGMPIVDDFPFEYALERLLIDPTQPEIAYGMAGADWELGLLRSTDGMQTWHKMDTTIVGSSPTIVVSHPDDPATLYTSGNVIQESYSTTDGGATWQPFTPVTAGDELALDPHNPDRMLLIDESTYLFESLDGGATFETIGGDFTTATVLDIEIAAADQGSVYVSNLGVGITRLGPDGPSHMSNSPDYSYDMEIDPDDQRILYATNSPKKFENHGSVWRYDPDQDAAFGWSEILRVDNSAGITSLAFDPSDTNTIYAGVTGAEGTIWVSHDRGENWSVLNTGLTFTTVQGHSQIVIDRTDDQSALVGTWGGGSYATSDGGESWSALADTNTFSPTCLIAAPSDPDIIYACDRTAAKVHRSIDGGESWSEYFDFGPGHLTTTAIGVDPNDPDLIYAATFRPPFAMLGSLSSIRTGRIVEDLSGGLPRAVLDIEVDEQNPSTLYATTHLHGLFRSDDAGGTWRQLDDRGTGLPRTGYLDVDVDPQRSQRLYATSLCGEIPDYVIDPVREALGTTDPLVNIDPNARCGVYRSDDRGETWDLALETIGQANGIAISRADPDDLFVADAAGGVWLSRDAGATWQQENTGLSTTSVTGLAVGDERIYTTTHGSGVFTAAVDASGSIEWEANSPRAYVYRLQIEVDPADPQRLYASAYPGGVLRSDDGGDTWSAKNFLTPSIRVTDPVLQGYYALEIDPNDTQTVWLGVYGQGLMVSRDGRDFNTSANGDDQLLRGKHITSVAVDPADSMRVLVGSEEGLYETSDGGRSWEQRDTQLDDIRSLEIGATTFAPVVVDFDEGHGDFTFESGWSVADGTLNGEGHVWAGLGSPLLSDYSFESELVVNEGGLHVNARMSPEGRYFVAFENNAVYLHKQFDQWQTFAELATASANVEHGRRHKVRIDLEGPRILVYIDGTLRIDYTDPDPLATGGIAFESLENSSVSIDVVRLTPTPGPSQQYAGTGGYGLYRFDEASQSWANAGRTFGAGWWAPWERRMYQFSSIVFDPTVEGRVYLGHFPSGFFISDDGGYTWRNSSVGLGNDGMFSVTLHPDDPNTLFAGTYNGIVTSFDGGMTWNESSTGLPPEQWPYTIAIDDASPNVMYASMKNGQNMGFCHRNEICGLVAKSIDGGQTWQHIMSGLEDGNEYYTLLIHPRHHDTLFLSSSGGVYISVDAGDSWWPIDAGLPTTHNQVRDNVADNLALTADQDTLLLGIVRHGVWSLDLSPLGTGG